MKKGKVFLALTFLVGMPTLMYFLSLSTEKRYTAQVRLQVDTGGPRFDNPSVFGPIDDMTSRIKPRNAATQVQIMTGTEVLGDAIQKAQQNLPAKLASNESAASAYESLVRRLQVDSDSNSDVVVLRVTEPDPEVAAEVANSIAQAYQEYVERHAKKDTQDVLTAFNSQIRGMKGKLDQYDSQIAAMKSKAKVADVQAAASVTTSTVSANQQLLDQTESQYASAVAELSKAQSLLRTIPRNILASSSTQANPLPISVQTDLVRLRSQLADLRARFTDDHPDVKAIRQQIRQNEIQLNRYKQNMEAGNSTQVNPAYQNQYSSVIQLQGRVDGLRSSIETLRAAAKPIQQQVSVLPGLQRELDGLLRDRAAVESSYMQILQRRDIIQAAEASRQPSVEVVSSALVPQSASFPDTRLFILAGIAVGGFLSILVLMPRQEIPEIPADYRPVAYTTAPPEPTRSTEPVTTTDSAGLSAGERRDS